MIMAKTEDDVISRIMVKTEDDQFRLAQLSACPRKQIFSKFCPQSAYVEFFATFAIKMP